MAANDHLSADGGGDAPLEPPALSGGPERSGAEAEPVNDPSSENVPSSAAEAGEGGALPPVTSEGDAVPATDPDADAGHAADAGSGVEAELAAVGEPAQRPEPEQEFAPEPSEPPPGPENAAPRPHELTPAPAAPRKRHHVAPALIALDRVIDDETFRIRPEGDLSLLATDIARLGQLFPVDLRLVPPDRFQVISGFRRVAALRFLQRDKVLARLHTDVDDEDALLMALAAAIHSVPVEAEELTAVKERLEEEGRLSAAARDMLEKALTHGEALAPEGPEVEIDADELALDVTARLGAINQDLALLADVFASLDEARRAELLDQLRYSADLVTFLEDKR